MPKTIYNKLVRDRIPEYLKSKGVTAVVHSLPPEERLPALFKKLIEEANELKVATPEKRREEIADILEVLKSLAEHLTISWADIEGTLEKKRKERGGFQHGVYLEYTEE